MLAKFQISRISIKLACEYLATNRAHLDEHVSNAIARARATRTPGRYRQRSLTAGREALAARLFHLFPELNGDYRRLTKALRAGHDGDVTDFDAINEAGAIALGLLTNGDK